ncbi:hypothetical protein PVAP13_8NG300000 [Panicum virgatum]|uniref:Uncharacterized protein n=1 Tax=Panicum virgatum TaxID=38727 RepID=A0A8T0PJM8_PANVG|nr:hypothetical protein PVAP13_8NG300000 [Panicum virgatum]KAG2559347.1 hypothetical protein PVAP13_8NG300000 [Panicum virgatum]
MAAVISRIGSFRLVCSVIAVSMALLIMSSHAGHGTFMCKDLGEGHTCDMELCVKECLSEFGVPKVNGVDCTKDPRKCCCLVKDPRK